MNRKNVDLDVLARYLSGQSTGTEKARVERWIEADPRNRQKLEEYKRIWYVSAIPSDLEASLSDPETSPSYANEDWERLNHKIEQQTMQPAPAPDKQFTNYDMSRKPDWYIFLRAAAIFLIAALIGVFAYQNWTPADTNSEEPVLREITTAMGQRVNLSLTDGTKVLLNAGSKIELPKVFDADEREVFLEGQAYFNVAKNPDKPFIIHSGNAQTRVLGTSFSVRAYPGNRQVTVAVEEGSVSFQPNDDPNTKQTIVKRHELVRYDLSTKQIETKKIDDLALYMGWVDGYLKFKEEPMEKVAIELERRYGVKVTFADDDIKNRLLTALLKSRSIRNVLDLISVTLDIQYKIDGDRVVFLRRSPLDKTRNRGTKYP